MAEPITNVLGIVSIKLRGEYDASITYEKLNVVTYQGSSYCAKGPTQGNLPTDTEFWSLIAEKGDKGDTGATPVKGVDYYTASDIADLENTLSDDVTTEVTSQLSTLTSATPLVASTLAGMTDTSRIYVLTTDGHWYWYDGDSWEDGGVYQAAEDSDTLQDVSDKVGIYWKNIIPLMNYLDYANLTNGKYYKNGNVGTTIDIGSASGYFIIPPFKVEKDVTYQFKDTANIGTAFCKICDGDGVILEPYPHQAGGKFTPNYDGYAYITFYSGNPENYPNGMVYRFDYPPKSFSAFGTVYDFAILNTRYKDMYSFYNSIKDIDFPIPHTVVTVGTGKDFTTITAAVASISDSSENKVYDILIDDGTYEEHSIDLPDYVNLIGASGNRDNCIIRGYLNPNVSDSDHRGVSTIDMDSNNELRNLTITAQNMRYPIHHESNGSVTNWTTVVENCHIEHFGNQEIIDYRAEHSIAPGNVWSSPHAWGEGSSGGAILKMKDTTLKSVENAFYVHAAPTMAKPYYHELVNCKLITSSSDQIAVYVDNNTAPLDGNTLVIKDTFIGGRYAIVANSYKYNAMISGSGIKPVYQRPGQVCADWSFPIFTDYVNEYVAGENISKGTFVYTTDGRTIYKANSTTNKKLIVGYTIGDHNSGELVNVMAGYLQPSSQTWPETPMTSNVYYALNNNGTLSETSNLDSAIAISNDYYYKLFI